MSDNNSFVQRKDNYNSHDKSINFKADSDSHPSPKRFTEGEQVLKVTQDFQKFDALSNFDKLYNKRIDWKPIVAANVGISKTPIQNKNLLSAPSNAPSDFPRSPQLLKGGA